MNSKLFKLHVLLVLVQCARFSFCVILDYTDFDDPFQMLLNTKNQVAPDPNSPCSGNIGNVVMEGVCKTFTECQLTGGTSAGFCGLLSTCCVYMGSCGNRLSSKISYFRSSNVPPNSSTCLYHVKPHNRNICQLRLDFISMILAPPANAAPNVGTCRDEKFFVEGYSKLPKICGKNNGQHMYVPVNGNDTNPITLHVDLLTQPSSTRSWIIKVTQLQCPGITTFPYRPQIETTARDFRLLAPENCLQYFTDMRGSLQTFGYDVFNPNSSAYSINETYAICFKRHREVCGISYIVDDFRLGASASGSTVADYLYVPAVAVVPSSASDNERISGQQPQNKVYTSVTPGPFYIFFKSDSSRDIATEIGFNIKYEAVTTCS